MKYDEIIQNQCVLWPSPLQSIPAPCSAQYHWWWPGNCVAQSWMGCPMAAYGPVSLPDLATPWHISRSHLWHRWYIIKASLALLEGCVSTAKERGCKRCLPFVQFYLDQRGMLETLWVPAWSPIGTTNLSRLALQQSAWMIRTEEHNFITDRLEAFSPNPCGRQNWLHEC